MLKRWSWSSIPATRAEHFSMMELDRISRKGYEGWIRKTLGSGRRRRMFGDDEYVPYQAYRAAFLSLPQEEVLFVIGQRLAVIMRFKSDSTTQHFL